MERNHICKKCGGIAGWDSYFQSWICTRCGNEEPKPQTNYDRIHAMSVEELAEFMCHNVSNGTVNCAFCATAEFCRMGHNGWLDWLKQEVET